MSAVMEAPDLTSYFKDEDDLSLQKWSKLLELKNTRLTFALDHHINTRGDLMNFVRFPHIREIYETCAPHLVLIGSTQSFKAQSVNSFVHTPTGWKRMGDLQVGDDISTPRGVVAKVSQLQPQGVQKLYKFYLDDGREVETTCDHRWVVLRGKQSKKTPKGRKNRIWRVSKHFEVLTTKQILVATKYLNQRFTIPVPTAPVEKPEQELPLDPYFVGMMLGDGEIREANLRFSSLDKELLNAVNKYVAKFGLILQPDKVDPVTSFFKKHEGIFEASDGVRRIKDLFKSLGLLDTYSHTKFIPQCYKEGSVEQRFAILQGLLDTDGSGCKHGGVTIRLTSEQLIKDIQEIVWSLGGCAKYAGRSSYYVEFGQKIEAKDCYILNISMPHPKQCFRLSRKKDNVSETHRRIRTLGAKVLGCEYSKDEEAQCIVVDDPHHLYLMDNYVVTHNTEMVITEHLAAAYIGLSVFFVIPKVESRTTYVQNRINKCVEMVPYYKSIVGEGFFNSVFLKSFGKGTIKYVGSNSLSDFREYPADMVYVDEVDECNQVNLQYAIDRVGASPYQFVRYLGNPDQPNLGIHGKFLETDQREWFVPCLSCGKYYEANWYKTIVKEVRDKQGEVVDYALRDTAWRPGIKRDVHMICPGCGGILHRHSKKGIWVPKKKDMDKVGYHLSKVCNLYNEIEGMWGRFQSAQGDLVKLKHFVTSELGIPFATVGNKLTDSVLQSCVIPNYKFVIKDDCAHIKDDCHIGPCSMGIDVGSSFDVRISYLTNRGTRQCVYVGKMKHQDDLYEAMDRYNVQVAVMDSEPEAAISREVQDVGNSKGVAVWLCKYRYSEGLTTSQLIHESDLSIHVDRTEALDNTFSALKRKRNLLPENFRDLLNGEYVFEMCSSVRETTEDAKGRRRNIWTKTKDHQFHADNFDRLAAELLVDGKLECIVG